MKLLTTPEEVAELWKCPGFIPAFHFIFNPDYDRQAVLFDSVQMRGALLPAREIGTQNMYLADIAAGDDRFIYLSPVRPASGLRISPNFGFVFDARDLITHGAYVNRVDLLGVYLMVAAEAFEPYVGPMRAAWLADMLHQTLSQQLQVDITETLGRWTAGMAAPPARTFEEYYGFVAGTLEKVTTDPKWRREGKRAYDLVEEYADSICAATREVFDRAQTNIRKRATAYTRRYNETQGVVDAPADRCLVAVNDMLDRNASYKQLRNLPTPEILWPGALPLARAVAAIALPRQAQNLQHGIRWPTTLFNELCQMAPTAMSRRRSLAGEAADLDAPLWPDMTDRAARFTSW